MRCVLFLIINQQGWPGVTSRMAQNGMIGGESCRQHCAVAQSGEGGAVARTAATTQLGDYFGVSKRGYPVIHDSIINFSSELVEKVGLSGWVEREKQF